MPIHSASQIATLLFLTAWTPFTALPAQANRFRIDHYTVDEGLAQSWVRAIAQDSAGYLWVGTSRGLQRFDGYSFVSHAELDPDAPNDLSGMILRIAVDHRGVAMFETDSGFHQYEVAGRRFRRLHADSVRVRHATDSLGRMLWIDPVTRQQQVYQVPGISHVVDFDVDRYGGLWVGGVGGLASRLSGEDRFVTVRGLGSQHVHDIEAYSRGGVLVLTDRALYHVDERRQVIEQWSPREVFETGLPQAIFEDREGGLWLGTVTAGLFRLDLGQPGFEHMSSRSTPPVEIAGDFVMSLHEQADGSLWVGTLRNGAFHLDGAGRRLHSFGYRPDRSGGLPSYDVWDFEEDDRGNLWIGSGNGLCRVTTNTPVCHETFLSAIARDDDGWFWLARESDVTSFNPATGRFGASVRLPIETVTLMADSGHLWIGGGGLFRAKLTGGGSIAAPERLAADASPRRRIFDFHRARDGTFWIGSDVGLQRWDSVHRTFAAVDIPDLRSITVFSIEEDSLGRLWLGTSHGLAQFSPSRWTVQRFRRQDGVLNSEFNRRASLRSRSGAMLFGGVAGVTRFHPTRLTTNREPPPLVFTKWRRVTGNGFTDIPMDDVDQLQLGRGDRAFTIGFAALTFASGVSRRYRYRLEGLSDAWIESSEPQATYPTPPPGGYVFRVQASAGVDGDWHQPGATVNLVVVPAFWATTWFRVLLSMMFLATLWGWHRMRVRRVLQTERLRMRISHDLHDEIGAGLSSIALLSDAVASNDSLPSDDRFRLHTIARSARDMVTDLRDIVWAVDPGSDRLTDVVHRMRDVASTLLHDVTITFDVVPPGEIANNIGLTARRDLLLIFKELLHNVARHAGAKNVRIVLESRGHEVRLVVADDGVGFPPGDLRQGTGLRSLHERAGRLGGELTFDSAVGKGTTATFRLRTT